MMAWTSVQVVTGVLKNVGNLSLKMTSIEFADESGVAYERRKLKILVQIIGNIDVSFPLMGKTEEQVL